MVRYYSLWSAGLFQQPVNLEELHNLSQKVASEIQNRKRRELEQLRAEIAAKARILGITPEDILNVAKKQTAPVVIKYRHPENPDLTWTGRGKSPHWVTEWLNSGRTKEELAV